MDAFDIFSKLRRGAQFDLKRFRNDAVKFRMVKEDDAYAKVSDTPGIGRKRTVSETSWKSIESNSSAKFTKIDPIEARQELGSPEIGSDEEEYDSDDVDEVPEDSAGSEEEAEEEDEGATLKLMSNLDAPEEGDVEERKKRRKNKKKGKNEDDGEVDEEEIARQQHVELINRVRNENRIHVLGTDIPDPVQSFSQLVSEFGVRDVILKNASEIGYHAPTPIQMQAIPLMLMRRELLACAPTGSGKTAAFLIPIIHHLKEPAKKGIRALIVAPTRELAAQIQRECVKLSEGTHLRCFQLDNIGKKSSKAVRAACSSKCDILVSTPNRLIHLLSRDPCPFSLKNVEWLIVDESDKLFETGTRGFREQLAAIYKACSASQVRRAMFSATFAFDVEEWCKLNLDNVVMTSVGARNTTVDTVQQELLFVGEEYGKLVAFRDMILKGLTPPVLVFVQSKDRAKELFKELIYDGINVEVIHSDLTQLQRDNVVKQFRMGKIWVLICTELMGRGIDFKGINLVINYDFPPTTVAYIHRIGRTGRAGRTGKAITYVTKQDFPYVRSVAQVIKASGGTVPDFMLAAPKTSKDMKRKLKNRALERDTIRTALMTRKELKQKKREGMKKKGIPVGDLKKNDGLNSDKTDQRKGKKKPVEGGKFQPKKVASTSAPKKAGFGRKKGLKGHSDGEKGKKLFRKKATKG